MSAWIATGPAGSRYQNVQLRVHAMFETFRDDGLLRVTVQTFDRRGRLLALDPILIDRMSPQDFDDYLQQSRAQGWSMVEVKRKSRKRAA
jgi:hypothetical protein